MVIQKYDVIQFQALLVLKDGKARKTKDFIKPISQACWGFASG